MVRGGEHGTIAARMGAIRGRAGNWGGGSGILIRPDADDLLDAVAAQHAQPAVAHVETKVIGCPTDPAVILELAQLRGGDERHIEGAGAHRTPPMRRAAHASMQANTHAAQHSRAVATGGSLVGPEVTGHLQRPARPADEGDGHGGPSGEAPGSLARATSSCPPTPARHRAQREPGQHPATSGTFGTAGPAARKSRSWLAWLHCYHSCKPGQMKSCGTSRFPAMQAP